MDRPYDATTRELLSRGPADWLALAGIRHRGPVSVLDTDLTTLTAQADKVFLVADPLGWLVHFELQSGRDTTLPVRVYRYNGLLVERYGLPTRSVIVALRREAFGPELDGRLRLSCGDEPPYLSFGYDVIRAWEIPVEPLLRGGLATLPMALIVDEAEARLPEVVRRIDERLRSEATESEAQTLWLAGGILLGLRYPSDLADHLLRGVRSMRESSVYQMILKEGEEVGERRGEQSGRLKEARRMLLRSGSIRLGSPDEMVRSAIEATDNLARLEELMDRVMNCRTWAEVFAG